MTDANEAEMKAQEHAADCAGQFIESVGPDMGVWTAEQFGQFIGAICGGYVESLMQQHAEVMAAMARVAA